MAFITLEDLTGTGEIAIFKSEILEAARNILIPDTPIIVEGTVSKRNGDISVVASAVRTAGEVSPVHVYFAGGENTALLQLREVLLRNRGANPVYLHFENHQKTVLTDRKYWFNHAEQGLEELKTVAGITFKIDENAEMMVVDSA